MVKIYVKRILAGEMTLEQVPMRWREAVREALGPDLSAMTKAGLLALCEERGITAYESWTKAEIIAAIEGAE